jgi:hypothetical protein
MLILIRLISAAITLQLEAGIILAGPMPFMHPLRETFLNGMPKQQREHFIMAISNIYKASLAIATSHILILQLILTTPIFIYRSHLNVLAFGCWALNSM